MVETARLFEIGFTASADDITGSFDAKDHQLFWRPRHAIRRADTQRAAGVALDSRRLR